MIHDMDNLVLPRTRTYTRSPRMEQTMAHGGEVGSRMSGMDSWIEAARRADAEALGRVLEPFRDYLLLVANQELEPELEGQARGLRSGPGDIPRRPARYRFVSRSIREGVAALAAGNPDSCHGESTPPLSSHRQAEGRVRGFDLERRPTSTGRRRMRRPARMAPART